MLRVPLRSAAASLTAVALAAAACDGATKPDAAPGDGGTGAPATAPTSSAADARIYRFRWRGSEDDLPWNRTLYLRPNLDAPGEAAFTAPAGVIFFPGEPTAPAKGRPGTRWELCTEAVVTKPMQRVLWVWSAEGTFGEEDPIDLVPPVRPRIALTGTEGLDPGTDTLTVVDEDSSARLAAVRDPQRGLAFATWDARHAPGPDVWTGASLVAPPRPWIWHEVREGKFAIAARAEGRQWIARRVRLTAGSVETFDVAGQPKGGGTVVCEDGTAELLLNGDVPIAPVRIVRDILRAKWDGVPPGSHVVRFLNGRTVKVDVADGASVTVPREAR